MKYSTKHLLAILVSVPLILWVSSRVYAPPLPVASGMADFTLSLPAGIAAGTVYTSAYVDSTLPEFDWQNHYDGSPANASISWADAVAAVSAGSGNVTLSANANLWNLPAGNSASAYASTELFSTFTVTTPGNYHFSWTLNSLSASLQKELGLSEGDSTAGVTFALKRLDPAVPPDFAPNPYIEFYYDSRDVTGDDMELPAQSYGSCDFTDLPAGEYSLYASACATLYASSVPESGQYLSLCFALVFLGMAWRKRHVSP